MLYKLLKHLRMSDLFPWSYFSKNVDERRPKGHKDRGISLLAFPLLYLIISIIFFHKLMTLSISIFNFFQS